MSRSKLSRAKLVSIPGAEGRRARLLVIEDDEAQRELMAMLLETAGLDCETASSLRSARAALDARDYDLIVSDFDLGDGYANALLDHDHVERSQIVFVSARMRSDIPRNVPFFRKPIDVDSFIDSVREMLGEPPASPVAERPFSGAFELPTPRASVELALYVNRHSMTSTRAEARLREALSEWDTRDLELHVIDLREQPDQFDPEDRVVFTPTLVRRRPEPRIWLVGELDERDALDELLEQAGLCRKPSAESARPVPAREGVDW